MSTERSSKITNKEDPLSIYDNPLGEIPVVPISQFSHVDGNGHKRPDGEVEEFKSMALKAGAQLTDRPNGVYNSTVIKHKAWIWIGGALATAMGLTAVGVGTALAIEHHRRNKKTSKQK